MSKIIETLFLKEVVKAEIWRGHRGFFSKDPDELVCVNDLIVNDGRTYIAKRISSGDSVVSAMAHMAVGSGSTAAGLTDTALVHESAKKALAVNSATANNVYTAVATFGGDADGITSVELKEACITNHAGSGTGLMFQRVTFSTVTLAASDIVKITLQTNVGSNTI